MLRELFGECLYTLDGIKSFIECEIEDLISKGEDEYPEIVNTITKLNGRSKDDNLINYIRDRYHRITKGLLSPIEYYIKDKLNVEILDRDTISDEDFNIDYRELIELSIRLDGLIEYLPINERLIYADIQYVCNIVLLSLSADKGLIDQDTGSPITLDKIESIYTGEEDIYYVELMNNDGFSFKYDVQFGIIKIS